MTSEPTAKMRQAAYDALPPELRIAPADLDVVLNAVLLIAERNRDERYVRLLAANRKLVDRLHELERIEDERDRALGQLEDARRREAATGGHAGEKTGDRA